MADTSVSVPTSFITPDVVQGTTTSWLPVTTAYPSLSGCASAFFLFPGQPAPAAWDPGYGYFAGAALRCLPPEATSWWELNNQNPDGYTSLSIQPIVCPQAFTTAVTETRSSSSTLVMCCPSGYDVLNGQPGRVIGDCFSPLSSGQVIPFTARAANYSWISATLTVTASTSIYAVPMIGWNVGRAASSATSSSSLATSTSSSTTPDNGQSSHGLSAGAAAGIGIGVAIGVIALAGLAVFLFRRRRHRHSRSQTVHSPTVETKPPDVVRHEMHQPKYPAHELYNQPTELESRQISNAPRTRH